MGAECGGRAEISTGAGAEGLTKGMSAPDCVGIFEEDNLIARVVKWQPHDLMVVVCLWTGV